MSVFECDECVAGVSVRTNTPRKKGKKADGMECVHVVDYHNQTCTAEVDFAWSECRLSRGPSCEIRGRATHAAATSGVETKFEPLKLDFT